MLLLDNYNIHEIFCRKNKFKPYNFEYSYPKKSCLSISQHGDYVNLAIKFKSMLENKLKPSSKDLTVFTVDIKIFTSFFITHLHFTQLQFLKNKIAPEQKEFQKWLQSIAKKLCKEEYSFVKPTARKFLRVCHL